MTAYTFIFYTLLSMNSGLCRLVKINFLFLKDTAFIASKSCFDQCTDCWVISMPKMQTDRQTDRQLFSFMYVCIYIYIHYNQRIDRLCLAMAALDLIYHYSWNKKHCMGINYIRTAPSEQYNRRYWATLLWKSLVNCPWFAKLKPSKLVATYN